MTKSPLQNQNPDSYVSLSNPLPAKKRTRRSVPRDSPPQRSSIYRGVTRHRWTGRYEAHLWDKNCWNESQKKKGRQVYLGAYDDEKAAAHAYDLAALKYWGPDTILNFPLQTYQKELTEMEGRSREEYIGSLRRKSSGFSRGVSKYRGVARHHHNGRWEARIGRVFGNKYLYLGTYATQEEAATAYDLAAIEYRGLNAVTNFDLSRYIKWLKPTNHDSNMSCDFNQANPNSPSLMGINPIQKHELGFFSTQQELSPVGESSIAHTRPSSATSALGLLLQSTKFKEMMEMSYVNDGSLPMSAAEVEVEVEVEVEAAPLLFPRDLQTSFGFEKSLSYGEEDDVMFGDLNSFISHNIDDDFDSQELGESAMEELRQVE